MNCTLRYFDDRLIKCPKTYPSRMVRLTVINWLALEVVLEQPAGHEVLWGRHNYDPQLIIVIGRSGSVRIPRNIQLSTEIDNYTCAKQLFVLSILDTYLVEHVGAKQHLEGVVVDECVLQFERFPVAHIKWSYYQHTGQVCDDQGYCWNWIVYQGIWFSTVVWKKRNWERKSIVK